MFGAVFNFLGRKRGHEWNGVNENRNEFHWKKQKTKWPTLKG